MTNIAVSERRNWLGASEVAALFNLSPYVTRFELYHLKSGNIPGDNLDSVERIQAGQFLEPSIAAWASHKWDWPIKNKVEYLTHPTVERMGCSLDFETEDGEPVEVKNVDGLIFRNGDWACEGDMIIDAPAHFLLQVQHQLACLPGKERGWLVVCVGGNKLYRMEVPRHDNVINKIEAEVKEFWHIVDAKQEPEPDFNTDADVISKLYYGEGGEVIDLRDDDRAQDLCAEYLAAHQAEKEASARKKAALAEMKMKMTDARCAMVGHYKVKASHVKAGISERSAHWRFNVTFKPGDTN